MKNIQTNHCKLTAYDEFFFNTFGSQYPDQQKIKYMYMYIIKSASIYILV